MEYFHVEHKKALLPPNKINFKRFTKLDEASGCLT
jgi:hypothetical protein